MNITQVATERVRVRTADEAATDVAARIEGSLR
jgi:hypothetical protein